VKKTKRQKNFCSSPTFWLAGNCWAGMEGLNGGFFARAFLQWGVLRHDSQGGRWIHFQSPGKLYGHLTRLKA